MWIGGDREVGGGGGGGGQNLKKGGLAIQGSLHIIKQGG